MTYRVTLGAPAPEMGAAAPLLLAAEEECEKRGWRLRALSWNEGRWTAVVEGCGGAAAVQAGLMRVLREGDSRSAAVSALPLARDRERAILEIVWRQSAAFYVASA